MAKKKNYFENEGIEVTEQYDIVGTFTKDEKNDIISAITKYGNNRKIVRFLVDQYYQCQSLRIATENQARAVAQGYDENEGEDHPLFIKRTLHNAKMQEELSKKYIDITTNQIPVCRWMKSIKGVGPIISAYLYSAFDVTQVHYATEFLSYAGLNDNNNKWLKKEGAKELATEAKNYRKMQCDRIDAAIREYVKKYTGKDDIDKELEKLYKKTAKLIDDKEAVDFDGILRNEFKIKSYDETLYDFIGDCDANVGYMHDFILYSVNHSRADAVLYAYAAAKTHRKFESIEKGTVSTYNSKKTKKTKWPTVEDFESYLAKPPYNLDLKTTMYKIGDCFIKNKNRGSLYGEIFTKRLAEETIKNDMLLYKDQAEAILNSKDFSRNDSETKKCLMEGKLSKAHLAARARRYAVKMFVSHVFEAMWWCEYHTEPPKHYILSIGGHHDYIAPEVDYHSF